MTTLRPLLRPALVLVLMAAAAVAAPSPAGASHTWESYHWGRSTSTFRLALADNVTSQWDTNLRVASADWTASPTLDTTVVAGSQNPKNCRPTAGRVEVCNSRYGNTDWLGIAQIWASGSHITQGVVKLNDTYFNTASYNTPAWRQFVMCQEIGHTFGLGHVNETFTDPNTGSCMDYTNDPTGANAQNGPLNNEHPNQHDFDLLATIYAHGDSTTTVKATASSSGSGRSQEDWGRGVHGFKTSDGHHHDDVFVKDLGNGDIVVTHVFWAAHSH